MMPGSSRRKSTQENYAPTQRVCPREKCGRGLHWCTVVKFSSHLFFRRVVNIVPCKTCMSEICCKTSWIIYNLVFTFGLRCLDYTQPSQMEKSRVFMFWNCALNLKTKLVLTAKRSVPNAERSPRFI